MFRSSGNELTFHRLLLQEVMRHGHNTLCRRDILDDPGEVLQDNCPLDLLDPRTESVRAMASNKTSTRNVDSPVQSEVVAVFKGTTSSEDHKNIQNIQIGCEDAFQLGHKSSTS